MQHIFNEESGKLEKGSKTIQVIQKDLESANVEIKSADNSFCVHSDSFEINTGKSQRNESVLVAQLQETLLFRVSPKICQKISEEYLSESKVLLQQLEHFNIKKDVIVRDKGVIQKEKGESQQLLQLATTRINSLQKSR